MTNQAAQTMPFQPEIFRAIARSTSDTAKTNALLNAAREIERLTSALSQTAGVVEGWKLVPVEPTDAMMQAAMQREDDEPLSSWGKIVPAPHDAIYRAMLAAAPAASGVHPDALPDGTLSKSTAKRVTALAAASVSERARELADEWRHVLDDGEDGHELCASRNTVARFVNAIDTLEQALTQQRGERYCQSCKGSGEVIGLHASPSGDPQDDYEAPMACPKCDGTGDAK